MTNDKLDIKKVNPFTLTMPDNNYWSLGENLGKAWTLGKRLKNNNMNILDDAFAQVFKVGIFNEAKDAIQVIQEFSFNH